MYVSICIGASLALVAVYLLIRQGWAGQVMFFFGAVGTLCAAGFCAGCGVAILSDKGDQNDLAGIVLLSAGALLVLAWIAFWSQVLVRPDPTSERNAQRQRALAVLP